MVDLEDLARRARRTAERSRVRMACRVGVPIAGLTLASVASGTSISTCACIAAALFVVAALLRWRDRIGVECVTAGLALGAVPAVVAVILQGCGLACREGPAVSVGEVMCLLAGALAGLGVTWRAISAAGARPRRWIATLLIALATAALGCVGLGTAALAATILVVVAAATLALIPMAARAA